MNKTDVRGLFFDNVTKEEALSLIISRLEENRQTTVFTPNSEILEECVENAEIKKIISQSDILLPDGIGVVKASEILKTPLKEKVAGVEIGEELIKRVKGHSFFFIGGKPVCSSGESIAEKAARTLTDKYGCNVVGTMHGYFEKSGNENENAVNKINDSGADILYVCFGFPSQEKWIVENRDKMPNIKLFIALGGSLDIYAGEAKRAPKLFIKFGIEWLWRFICEPSRIARMLKLPKFYIGTLRYAAKIKKQNGN